MSSCTVAFIDIGLGCWLVFCENFASDCNSQKNIICPLLADFPNCWHKKSNRDLAKGLTDAHRVSQPTRDCVTYMSPVGGARKTQQSVWTCVYWNIFISTLSSYHQPLPQLDQPWAGVLRLGEGEVHRVRRSIAGQHIEQPGQLGEHVAVDAAWPRQVISLGSY